MPDELKDATEELLVYWKDSWGNRTRIDYGTGHEMFMASFYFCLRILGVLKREDNTAVILRCFDQYLALVRRIQKTYSLEPAGSHGVWSLDDYQALPFYFGACQLLSMLNELNVDYVVNHYLGNTDIKTSCAKDEGSAILYAEDYLYFSAIKFIFEVCHCHHWAKSRLILASRLKRAPFLSIPQSFIQLHKQNHGAK